MELVLSLEPAADRSLQTQLFDQIRDMILDGRLSAGAALPPSRALATRYGISRNTVAIAYDRLANEGYIEPRSTRGVFVTDIPPDNLLLTTRTARKVNGPAPEEQESEVLCFVGTPGGGSNRPALDMWVGRSASSAFPLSVWRRIIARLLARETQFLTDYCDPAGLHELRQVVSDHLGRSRGITTTPDQIVITSGGQEAINLVVSLLRPQTERLCLENPCYVGAQMVFESDGQQITPIPVDAEGLVTDLLPKSRRNLLYVTPSHQFPTGATLPLNRRLALLRWAEETDSHIIEDDYDSDFRYDGPPLTALAGLDRGRRTFYIGTFSKSVGAGLRVGYAVVPQMHWSAARLLKARMSNGQSWLEQRALAEFLGEGHFDRHLRKLTQLYRGRRDSLMKALSAEFGEVEISGQASGLHLAWHLPRHLPGAKEIQRLARAQGVGVYALSSGAAKDFRDDPPDRTLILGYSSLTEGEITAAIAILGRTLNVGRAAAIARG